MHQWSRTGKMRGLRVLHFVQKALALILLLTYVCSLLCESIKLISKIPMVATETGQAAVVDYISKERVLSLQCHVLNLKHDHSHF